MTAIRDGGIFALIFGQTIRIASAISPTLNACALIVPIVSMHSFNFSIVSIVACLNSSPKKSLICPITIVTAIPLVNPVTIVYGINLINPPSLKTPIRIKITPARIVAATRPAIPFCATIPATIVANAAVGPDICTRLPPSIAITNPATIAV